MFQWKTKFLAALAAVMLVIPIAKAQTDICDFTRAPSGVQGDFCFAAHDDGVAGYHATGSDVLNYVSSSLAIDSFTDVSNLSGAATNDLLSYDADSGLWYASAPHEALTGSGVDSIVIGDGATSSDFNTIAIGRISNASNDYSVAIGANANVTQTNSVAIGVSSTVSGGNSVALGESATASSAQTVAIGADSSATALRSIAIGGFFSGTTADETNCIAFNGANCLFPDTMFLNGITEHLYVSGTIYNDGKSEQLLTYTSSATLDSRAAGSTVLLDCASCTITIPDAKYDALESFEIISYGGTGNSIAAGGSLQLKFADTLNFSSRYSVAAVRFLSGSEAIVTGGFNAP